RTGDRVALMRHRRRTATAGTRRFEYFADLGLHHQGDIARDLAAGADKYAEASCDTGNAVAFGVPGGLEAQRKLLGELFGDTRSFWPGCRKGSGGAPELQHRRCTCGGGEILARARKQGRPARDFEPENGRQSLLEPRARGQRRLAVAAREPTKSFDRA